MQILESDDEKQKDSETSGTIYALLIHINKPICGASFRHSDSLLWDDS
jgi:hypothetical protein